MDTSSLLHAARRWWWLIVIGTLVAALASYALASSRPAQYEATSRLLVGPVDGELNTLRTAGLIALTYADLVTSESHLLEAAGRAGVPADLETLRSSVDAVANDTTRLLTIQVTHTDPTEAAALADELAGLVARQAAESAPPPTYEPGVTVPQGMPIPAVDPDPASMVQIVDPARISWEPLDQGVLLTTLLAAVMGAVLAYSAAVLLELAPWRSAPADADALLQRRYLGRVRREPGRRGSRGRRALASAQPGSRAARDYRLIATKIQHLTADRPLRSIAICGASGRDGSDLVAGNLALTFARDGRSVALADLTESEDLARRLALPSREQEVESANDSVLELAHVPVGDGTVKVLLSEAVRQATGGAKTRHLVDTLKEVADLVIVVAPPMLLQYGTLLIAQHADGVLLVGSDDEERIDDAVEAFDTLERSGVSVLGTVVATRHDGSVTARPRPFDADPVHAGRPARGQRGATGADEQHLDRA